MTWPRPRLRAATLVVAVAVLGAWRPPLLRNLDERVADGLAVWTGTPPATDRVAVVAIDERSLAQNGQWPWPRARLADLTDRLRAAGAAVVAFDVLFAEPERWPTAEAGSAGDVRFAATLDDGPTVAAAAFLFEGDTVGGACDLRPPPLVVRSAAHGEAMAGAPAADGVVCTLPLLTRAAGATGFINAAADGDGLLRRVPLVVAWSGTWHPSLALAAVARATSAGPLVIADREEGGPLLRVDGRDVALEAGGVLRLRFRGPRRTYRTWSAADVLADALPRGVLAGRIVFVGATGLGVRDTVATAFDTAFPGIEVHATAADILLGGAGAVRPTPAWLVEVLAAIAAIVLVMGAARRFEAAGGAVVTVLVLAGAWAAAWAAFAAGGLLFSPVPAALGALAAAGLETGALAWDQRRRADAEVERRRRAQALVVQALTSLTETRDRETGQHVRRTQDYTRLLAAAVAARPAYRDALPPDRVALLATLAPLHDIGKVGVADAVLNKQGPLDAAERAQIERHPTIGYETLERAERAAGVIGDEVMALAKDIVYTHHERWDGRGYPRGLAGPAIPLAGRIVAVVDAYDAMRSDRVYRAALPHAVVVAELTRGAGAQFDPEVVAAFHDVHLEFDRRAAEARDEPSVL